MEIVLATRNKGKLIEIRHILGREDIMAASDFPGCPDVVEDGSTFEDNAIKKARETSEFTGRPALSDDSGLEVKALGWEPGVFSARFAGERCDAAANNRKLLELMKAIPDDNRQARFRCVAVLYRPGGEIIKTEGVCEGIISREEKGSLGFGYDPLFIVSEYNKTFAELEPEIKNSISHRAKAFRAMIDYLSH